MNIEALKSELEDFKQRLAREDPTEWEPDEQEAAYRLVDLCGDLHADHQDVADTLANLHYEREN